MAMKDTRNIGPLRSHEGHFEIIPSFLPRKIADELFMTLLETIDWKSDVVKMFGKTIESRREVAFFGTEPLSYGYSGTRHHASTLPSALTQILKRVQERCDEPFNTILATRYPDGNVGVGWHRDDEPELGPRRHIQIASLSLGATRRFETRNQGTQEIQRIGLENGTLALMARGFQERWQHRVPLEPRITEPRINLSFRTLRTEPES